MGTVFMNKNRLRARWMNAGLFIFTLWFKAKYLRRRSYVGSGARPCEIAFDANRTGGLIVWIAGNCGAGLANHLHPPAHNMGNSLGGSE